ncbi:MAG: 5-oxoprolinase subunit PxpB [Acidaminococcaceae bacterium]|nr:5-oxoprolinase subunit PxpB [Acidaminococcaceae bacterium]MDD4722389.1 5-oxoprolinase subunit PxpB [Acidaminococcaceae bacterium]
MNNVMKIFMEAKMQPLGEAAIQVSFGDRIDPQLCLCARALAAELEKNPFPGLKELEVSYTGVAVFFEPLILIREKIEKANPELSHSYQVVENYIKTLLKKIKLSEADVAPRVRVPVCYGGEYGPDLEYVAKYHKLTQQEVIDKHISGDYLVYMIGFAPGFPYVGGLPEDIATPRRETPRLAIPKGSVGIAGSQTGAYPLETPGGWQLIGRTPLELFRLNDLEHPSVLQAGDRLEFYAITPGEFKRIAAQEGSVAK